MLRVTNRCANNKPSYKLILMDFSMPELDGPTTTKMIRDFFRV